MIVGARGVPLAEVLMRFRTMTVCGLAVAGLLGTVRPTEAQCEPDGDVQFLCGPVSPEDLVAVPESPWVIASGMEDDGYLYAIDTRDLRSTVLFPSGAPQQPQETPAGHCAGPPAEGFRPHGLSVRPGDGGQHTLYVVRHGAREAIEIFKVDAGGAVPVVTWMDCVVAPDGVEFNSVAALPEGGFAASHFTQPMGELWEWASETGWVEVPGSRTEAPNGLVVSPDGRWFYVGGWGSLSVVRLSRGQTPPQIDSVGVGFHVDNIRWAPDGSLLAAGHRGNATESIMACLDARRCDDVTSRVARIDPVGLSAEEIVRYPSNDVFVLGTVALQVGDEIWLGGIGGSDRIARFPTPR